jgi:hypothetical protein
MMTMSFVCKPDYFDHYNRFVRTTLNGWTVSGIWTANSGRPFTVTTGVDNYLSDLGNNRPSVIPGKSPHTVTNRSRVVEMKQWFDTSAIAHLESMPVALVSVHWACLEHRSRRAILRKHAFGHLHDFGLG